MHALASSSPRAWLPRGRLGFFALVLAYGALVLACLLMLRAIRPYREEVERLEALGR